MTLSAIPYLNTFFPDIFDQYTWKKNEYFNDKNQNK